MSESITYLDAEGAERTGAYWSEAPSVPGFVRCKWLRADGRWILIGQSTKDRKTREAVALLPGQSIALGEDGLAVCDPKGAQS